MASDLLQIGLSGTRAARAALDVAAQNIANASTPGYVRRTVRLEELASAGSVGQIGDISLSGVRVAGVTRNADLFRQSELRRTGSDAARASAEVAGLENVEAALEQSGLYPAIVRFEASLQRLAADPVELSLRAEVLADARTMAQTITIADTALNGAGDALRFEASDGVEQVNLLAGELARVNLRLSRASDATSDQTALLDQRDELLRRISVYADISTSIAANHTVEVRIGGAAGPQLVSVGTANPLAMATAADGTVSFTLGGGAVSLAAGELAGTAQALTTLAAMHDRLDSLASTLAAAANGAQTGGVALDGSAGQPLFSGTSAATIAVALSDGAQLATAPAGAGAGSRDPANLDVLRDALASAGVAEQADAMLFAISGMVAGRSTTRDALQLIADTAAIALEAQAGVDLDQEAANLLRFQQAFQASGKAMQVAATLFDTLMEIR